MTTPLLEGLDGVNKMSKSLGNYVGITDSPEDMFGKLMSVSDELMWRYFELLSFRPLEEIESLRAAVAEGRNPRDVKFELATEIVERFHDAGAAEGAKDSFIRRHRGGGLPDEMPEHALTCDGDTMGIAYVLKESGLAASTSEAMRLISQGAVRVDGDRVEDRSMALEVGGEHVVQVGKRRFAKVSLTAGS